MDEELIHELHEQIYTLAEKNKDLTEYIAACSAMLPGPGVLAVRIQRLLDSQLDHK